MNSVEFLPIQIGSSGQILSSDPDWKELGCLKMGRSNYPSIGIVGSKLVIVGGKSDSALNNANANESALSRPTTTTSRTTTTTKKTVTTAPKRGRRNIGKFSGTKSTTTTSATTSSTTTRATERNMTGNNLNQTHTPLEGTESTPIQSNECE